MSQENQLTTNLNAQEPVLSTEVNQLCREFLTQLVALYDKHDTHMISFNLLSSVKNEEIDSSVQSVLRFHFADFWLPKGYRLVERED